MAKIKIANAKDALSKAFDMWLNQNPEGFEVDVDGASVNIIYKREGNRLDFGFPNLYPLPNADFLPLKQWWENKDSRNKLLGAQFEPASGLFKINAMTYPVSPLGVTLNFHIPTC
jgi:hypothetical protein